MFGGRGMFFVVNIKNISFCGKVCRWHYEIVRKEKRISMTFNKACYLKSVVFCDLEVALL